MAGLVLAESYLHVGTTADCENYLKVIEERTPHRTFSCLEAFSIFAAFQHSKTTTNSSPFITLTGGLTIFEAAEDLYHSAVAHFFIGGNLPVSQSARAIKHLTTAGEIFKKLSIPSYIAAVAEKIRELKDPKLEKNLPPKSASEFRSFAIADGTACRGNGIARVVVPRACRRTPAGKPGQKDHHCRAA